MKSKVCRCGTRYEFESIPFGQTDLGEALAPVCPACAEVEAEQVRAAEDERRKQGYRERVLGTLPPDLLPVWLDSLGTDPDHADFPQEAWQRVRRWRPGARGGGLGLVGPAAAGKTRLLVLLAEKIIMQGIRLVWTSAMRLHKEAAVNLRSRERKISEAAREHLMDCQAASYLVIDDLGNNEWCPAFESELFSLLDHRRNHRLPTLWSANAHPEEFHLLISSVNPAALIGRLLDGTAVLNFYDEPELLKKLL